MNRFDIVEAHYWWNTDHHTGQWSREYRRLCRMRAYFTPGHSTSTASLIGTPAGDIYDALCDSAGCIHARLAEEETE